uniref:Odorant-binding protein 4 n=1 Tax=Microplitis mediator TaxID=375433 RepID=A1YWY5_9HYME|nr:odorant-binding protein 4 [Microplitis mediator]
MKCFTLTAAGILFTVLITVNNASSNSNMEELVKKSMEETFKACKDKLTPENFALLNKDPHADNQEIKCFKACGMNHAGIMADGKIQIEKMEEKLNSLLGEDKKDFSKIIIGRAKPCVEEANKGENECDVAAGFEACVQKTINTKSDN